MKRGKETCWTRAGLLLLAALALASHSTPAGGGEVETQRSRATYIRDIDPLVDSEFDAGVDAMIEESSSLGVPFVRVRDSVEIASHAARLGLLPTEAIARIETDTEADRRCERSGKASSGGRAGERGRGQ